jgi:hypothetical protein
MYVVMVDEEWCSTLSELFCILYQTPECKMMPREIVKHHQVCVLTLSAFRYMNAFFLPSRMYSKHAFLIQNSNR